MDASFGWLNVPVPAFPYAPSTSSQLIHGTNAVQSLPKAEDSRLPLFLPSQITSVQPLAQALSISTNLVPAWPDLSLAFDEAISYTPADMANASTTPTLNKDQADMLLSAWGSAQADPLQPQPSAFHSSLPPTPTLPRQAHRFASLPSTRSSSGLPSPISPTRVGSWQGNSETRYNVHGMTNLSFTPDLFRIPASW